MASTQDPWMASKGDHDRGRASRQPRQIPARGWLDIAVRVFQQQSLDNLSIVAAGVAFYALLAIFPALTALVSVYAIVADPAQAQQQIQGLSQVLPKPAWTVISGQVGRLVANSGGALGWGVIAGIVIAFWSAAKGTKSLLSALDIAYGETEKRGLIRFNAMAFALTIAAILAAVVAIALVVALPILLNALGWSGIAGTAVSVARWLLLAVGVGAALGVLYRLGPSRRPPQWRWVSPGSVAATVLWLIASILFSLYIANFGSYNATYGTLGAVIILLLWLDLTAYIILLGAEINSEAERQTLQDSTRGPPAPLGERGAWSADTVAGERDPDDPGPDPSTGDSNAHGDR